MAPSRRRARVLALAALSLLAASCGGSGGGGDLPGGGGAGGGPTSSVSGRVIFDRGPLGALTEVEPNDSVSRPFPLGNLYPAQDLRLLGTASAAEDPFDGFSLSLPIRVRVRATLRVTDGGSGAAALSLYDPISMQFLGDAAGGGGVKTLDFVGKGTFDLVVRALSGTVDYSLQVVPTSPTVPIQEVGDAKGAAACLGEVQPGDAISYGGTLTAPADAVDEVLVTCPAAVRVALTLAYPVFSDFDLEVLDATSSLATPVLLGVVPSPVSGPAAGVVDLAAGTLLVVRVSTASGQGPYALTIAGQPPPAPVLAASRAHDAPRVAPATAEGSRVEPAPPGAPPYGRGEFEIVRREALVAFDDADAEAAVADVEARGARIVEVLSGGVRRVALPVREGLDDVEAARAEWSRIRGLSTARVRYAEANSLHRAFETEPDDAYYPLQWPLVQLNLPRAWDLTTGSADVVVAVVDTGVRDHPDLTSRLMAGYDFVSDAWNANDGGGRDADPTDPGDAYQSFHGTHVCGTVGAATDNGVGVAGVTWATRIMPLRALGWYGGTDADLAEAVRYAARLSNASGTLPAQRAHVINLSLGSPSYAATLQAAVTAARDQGVVVVAAAGNANSATPNYPAAYAGVLSVMATDLRRQRAPYSSYGSTVDLAAPGGDTSVDRDGDGYGDGVLSTRAHVSGSAIVPSYEFLNGTSMAAPHVAGVAALLLARNPLLTGVEVEEILAGTAVDLGAPGRDDVFGHGLVDAHAAVSAATPGAPPPPPALGVLPDPLYFGGVYVSQTLSLGNLGSGFVSVGAITTSTKDGAPWLAATALPGAGPGVSVGQVRVDVNRAGLAAADYRGAVTVASDAGVVVVEVVMTVLTVLPAVPDVEIVVRARRADTGQVAQTVAVNPARSLLWSFPTLPTGRYVFEASSDNDRDGVVFEDGDYGGRYPVLADPVEVDVVEGVPVTGIEFAVTLQRVLTAGAR